jgi:putative DNA primase/helicase
MSVSIAELQAQRRWVLWRFVQKPGKDKPDKVPFQLDGRMARTNDPSTWSTHTECAAVVSGFDGIGLVLGDVDGVAVFGVDIDGCCDAITGKFSPESRGVVIGLDSYGEYSPSGTGCHVFGVGTLPGDGKPIVRPFPGCKQIEIKGRGFYFTLTGRHLSKTPKELVERQTELTTLCERVQAASHSGVIVTAPLDEETKFQKLWAGDMSDFGDDHSRADLALCCILARRLHNDVFKIDDEFRKSELYREKWERSDYSSRTILKAIQGEPIFDSSDHEPIEDDGPTEYLVDALPEPMHEGWFPKGEVSLIGGLPVRVKLLGLCHCLRRFVRGRAYSGTPQGRGTIACSYMTAPRKRCSAL